MFLGWYDPDKKKTPSEKVAEATARYREKFGGDPEACICNPVDAAALDGIEIIVTSETYIPRHTFYIGVQDAQA